ncbi:hypothetical protein K3495_g1352 [Podosphaera aphanis]|nr:hypothetical protein K3495_g1352 [Podosphaera aphanis]
MHDPNESILIPPAANSLQSLLESARNPVTRLLKYASRTESPLPESLMTNTSFEATSSETIPSTIWKNNHLYPLLTPLCCALIEPIFLGTIRKPPLPPFTMTGPIALSKSSLCRSPDSSSFESSGLKDRTTKKKKKTDCQAQGYDVNETIETQESNDLRRLTHPEHSRPTWSPHNFDVDSSLPKVPHENFDTEHVNTSESKNSKKPMKLSPSNGGSGCDVNSSPGPLGLIPIHSRWSVFVHRHEVPRKLLHVSIGLISIYLYLSGVQTTAITPWLMGALIPIAATDYLRHHFESLNIFYVRILGALMRESEFRGWNGVIWYLLGAWVVLSLFPKDVGLMGILLLSWCDTAASTLGRAYGRYTPSIRKGKSLAGSLAAFTVGVATAAAFWGWLAPSSGPFPGDENFPFMFTGVLRLPLGIREWLGWTEAQSTVGGYIALSIISLYTGVVASLSEAVNLWGWDDNLTIPVLSGIGMWSFLRIYG